MACRTSASRSGNTAVCRCLSCRAALRKVEVRDRRRETSSDATIKSVAMAVAASSSTSVNARCFMFALFDPFDPIASYSSGLLKRMSTRRSGESLSCFESSKKTSNVTASAKLSLFIEFTSASCVCVCLPSPAIPAGHGTGVVPWEGFAVGPPGLQQLIGDNAGFMPQCCSLRLTAEPSVGKQDTHQQCSQQCRARNDLNQRHRRTFRHQEYREPFWHFHYRSLHTRPASCRSVQQ